MQIFKFSIQINANPIDVENYLVNKVGNKNNLLEREKVIGKIKNGKVKLEYNNEWKRFPTGVTFHGRIIKENDSSLIKGYFLFTPLPLFYIWIIILSIVLLYENSPVWFTLLIFAGLLLAIDLYWSYQQRVHVVDMLQQLRRTFS